jgi:hypothetical protein
MPFWRIGIFGSSRNPAQENVSMIDSIFDIFRTKKPVLPVVKEKPSLKKHDSAIQLQDARHSIASSINPHKCSVCEGSGYLNLRRCIACDGTGLPSSNTKKIMTKTKKWYKTIKSWFKKDTPNIVLVRGRDADLEQPEIPERPVLAKTRPETIPDARVSLDPGVQSEWAKALRAYQPPNHYREEYNCNNSKLNELWNDLADSSEIDFSDIACRYVYAGVD